MKNYSCIYSPCFFYVFLLTVIILIPFNNYAQETPDSLNVLSEIENGVVYKFKKDLDIYTLGSILNFNYRSSLLNTGVFLRYNSVVVESGLKNIRDELLYNVSGYWFFSRYFEPGLNFEGSLLNDNRKTGINEIHIIKNKFFVNSTPLDSLRLQGFAGYITDNQLNREDSGLLYGFKSNYLLAIDSSIHISTRGLIAKENISPRENSDIKAGITLSGLSSDYFSDKLEIDYFSSSRDFYFEADSATASIFNVESNIQKRREDAFIIQNNIKFMAYSDAIEFFSSFKLTKKNIKKENRYYIYNRNSSSVPGITVEQSGLDVNFGGNAEFDFVRIFIQGGYSENEEMHLPINHTSIPAFFYESKLYEEQKKNFINKQSFLSLKSDFSISASDILSTSFIQRKIQFDTPSDQNFDDRDELMTLVKASYLRKFSSRLDLIISAEGSISKLVYIYSQKSANNLTKRSLKYSGEARFSSGIVKNNLAGEVNSSYSVFDFEKAGTLNKSYLLRQLIIKDSLELKLNYFLKLKLNTALRFSEQGNFFWQNFSSQPTRFLEEKLFEGKIETQWMHWIFRLGIKHFSLLTFSYTKDYSRSKISDYYVTSPIFETDCRYKKILLNFTGSLDYIKTENKETKINPFIDLVIKYNF